MIGIEWTAERAAAAQRFHHRLMLAAGLTYHEKPSPHAYAMALGLPEPTVRTAVYQGTRLSAGPTARVVGLASQHSGIVTADAWRALLGWAPGDPCPCGCGAVAIEPDPRALLPWWERPCPGPEAGAPCPQGEVRVYRGPKDHSERCKSCRQRQPRVDLRCVGFEHGPRRRADGSNAARRCPVYERVTLDEAQRRARSRRPLAPYQRRAQREGNGAWSYRCGFCARSAAMWARRLERLRAGEQEVEFKGEGPPRSRNEMVIREGALIERGDIFDVRPIYEAGRAELHRTGAHRKPKKTRSRQTALRYRLASIVRPWTQPETWPNVHVFTCERCGDYVIHAGPKPGAERPHCSEEHRFHPPCRREVERDLRLPQRAAIPLRRGRPRNSDRRWELACWVRVRAYRLGLPGGMSQHEIERRDTRSRRRVIDAVDEGQQRLNPEKMPRPYADQFALLMRS